MMQASSRESLGAVRAQLDELTAGRGSEQARTIGGELSAVAGVLRQERVLLRNLADPAVAENRRAELATAVFGGKVGEPAVAVLRTAVSQRWSAPRDLIDAVEQSARQAVLTAAETDGTLDETEDELFRFGRVLESEGRLSALLSDLSAPVEKRVGLLRDVVGGKVGRDTMELLEQAVRHPHGRGLDVVVDGLAEQAAQRRQRTVAVVTAAAPLSAEQEQRLATVLSGIYNRAMSVQVEIDPEVLGGLVVRVGDEVIDGSVASRLTAASRGLPS